MCIRDRTLDAQKKALLKIRVGRVAYLRRRVIIDKYLTFILGGACFTPDGTEGPSQHYDSLVHKSPHIASVDIPGTGKGRCRGSDRGRGGKYGGKRKSGGKGGGGK
eukprot:1435395-Prymnesium_polylepis.1